MLIALFFVPLMSWLLCLHPLIRILVLYLLFISFFFSFPSKYNEACGNGSGSGMNDIWEKRKVEGTRAELELRMGWKRGKKRLKKSLVVNCP